LRIRQLSESINDRGKFKAIFLAGMPGAGKTQLVANLYDAYYGAKVIDTDKFAEFIADKTGNGFTQSFYDSILGKIKHLRVSELVNAINGMLPMYLAGTGSLSSAIFHRDEILESFGYDTAMIWVGTDVYTAISNMQMRKRKIPLQFIIDNFSSLEEHYLSYQQHFGKYFYSYTNVFMTEEENEELQELAEKDRLGTLSGIDAARFDQLVEKLDQVRQSQDDLSKVQDFSDRFFGSAIRNAKGQSTVSYLERTGGKYLTDGVISLDKMQEILSSWGSENG
jgi:shikimate kinase